MVVDEDLCDDETNKRSKFGEGVRNLVQSDKESREELCRKDLFPKKPRVFFFFLRNLYRNSGCNNLFRPDMWKQTLITVSKDNL